MKHVTTKQDASKKIVTCYMLHVLCMLVLLFSAQSVHALSLFPTKQTVVLDPGTSHVVSIDLYNESEETLLLTPEVEGFAIDELTKNIQHGVYEEAKQWFEAERLQYTLLPTQSQRIAFTIHVPEHASPGARYVSLFASSRSEDEGNVAVQSRVGSLLFLHVTGEIDESLQVQDFSTGRTLYTKGPVQVHTLLENNGNIHVVLNGVLKIRHSWWGEWYEETFVTEGQVLARNKWKQRFDDIPLGLKQIGKHEVTMVLQYGEAKKGLTKTIRFYYIPIWLYVGVGFLLFLGVMSIIKQGVTGVARMFKRK